MVGAGKERKRQVCEEGGTLSPARLGVDRQNHS